MRVNVEDPQTRRLVADCRSKDAMNQWVVVSGLLKLQQQQQQQGLVEAHP